jgi:hypothetical protein
MKHGSELYRQLIQTAFKTTWMKASQLHAVCYCEE